MIFRIYIKSRKNIIRVHIARPFVEDRSEARKIGGRGFSTMFTNTRRRRMNVLRLAEHESVAYNCVGSRLE